MQKVNFTSPLGGSIASPVDSVATSIGSGAATQRAAPDARLAGLSSRVRAKVEGDRVRRQVRVQSHAPGIIETSIRPAAQGEASVARSGSPLAKIQALMKEDSRYTRLTVVGGSSETTVLGTENGALPRHPDALTQDIASPAAIVNGGYFIHKQGLTADDGQTLDKIGTPIGPTSHRQDHQPISTIWKPYYGQVKINDETGLCSGPLLARNGALEPVPFEDNKFLYRPDGKTENELNKLAGAMTPCGDPIERSAISVNMSSNGEHGDVIMHALTAGGSRTKGATMADWQKMTKLGADSAQDHARTIGTGGNASTLALDGGGSTYLGVRSETGLTTLVHGIGGISGDAIRPTPNVIASKPALPAQGNANAAVGGRISIDQAPQD